jgi:carboxymethylenebutenolidase
MNQEIIDLYDEYTHKPLPRKTFINRLVKLTGSLSVAMTFLPLLENNYTSAQPVPADETLDISDITYNAGSVVMKGYQAKPKTKGKKGAVIVIHENRGLTPHIKDVTRRAASAGFIALAVDALSPFGGTPANEDEARALFAKIDRQQNLDNFIKGFEYLEELKDCNGKTGCVGFCWGGGLVNQLAVNVPELDAAVAYYGQQPAAADVPKIKSSVMLHYGGLDTRINAGIPEYEAALKAAGTDYQLFVYEGVNHAFNNDSSPARYNEAAAKLAWSRTLELFRKKLG